jgi:hypothetical protein
MTPAPPDLKRTLEEMRASAALRGARKGFGGAIEAAILGLLGVLLAMLEDFRAGRLPPITAPAAMTGTEFHPAQVPVIPAQSPDQARGGIQCVRQRLAEPALYARTHPQPVPVIPAQAGIHVWTARWAQGARTEKSRRFGASAVMCPALSVRHLAAGPDGFRERALNSAAA